MNDCGNAKREMTSFERLVSQMEAAVIQSRYDSSQYREILSRMDKITLDSEQAVKSSPGNSPIEEAPDTLMYKLYSQINELEAINRKNAEIISNFKTLI
jgi:hypothetical protein